MLRIIPQETYKYIEAKLHGYDEIKREVEEWRLSVQYPEKRERIPGAGYISDPTAKQAIRLAEPPKYIRKQMKWAELIEQAQKYCGLHGNRIFDIWYGKGRQKSIRAYTRNSISKATFKKNRNSAVYYVLVRAIDGGMCRLKESAQK